MSASCGYHANITAGTQAGGQFFRPVPVNSERDFGVIAQLGERYNGIVEVGGSIPPGSTRTVKDVEAVLSQRPFCLYISVS